MNSYVQLCATMFIYVQLCCSMSRYVQQSPTTTRVMSSNVNMCTLLLQMLTSSSERARASRRNQRYGARTSWRGGVLVAKASQRGPQECARTWRSVLEGVAQIIGPSPTQRSSPHGLITNIRPPNGACSLCDRSLTEFMSLRVSNGTLTGQR